MSDKPVDVRIVGATTAQLLSIAGACAVVLAVVVVQRRRTLIPLVATRAARRLRTLAQRLEDAGLDVARTTAKESTP